MPDTVFRLQRVDTRIGPLALVTIDDGEDWTKPPALGRSALQSGLQLLEELESGDWVAGVFTGKPLYVWISNQIGNTGMLTGFVDSGTVFGTGFPFNPNPDTYKPKTITGAPATTIVPIIRNSSPANATW